MKKAWLLILSAALTSSALAQVAQEYSVSDLGTWTAGQLAGLPYFDRYIPLAPSGASSDFSPVCRSGTGITAGLRNPDDTLGAYVKTNSQTDIIAWGTYNWSYWIWDGQDNHYYWGSVTHSPAKDINVFGQIVGYATLPGGGSGVGSPGWYDDHGYMRDTASGEHLDLTPNAHRADLRAISDRGVITGTWSSTNTFHAFRRTVDGTFHDYSVSNGSVSPALINNHDLIAGTVTIWTTPRIYYPFVSSQTNEMIQLPLPTQGSPDIASVLDMNDHGLIVGEAHKAASPVETGAVRWFSDGNGWTAEDLNELLADGSGDYIIDRAIAVNDAGHIIARGHPDGSDVIGTHTLLLTPDLFPAPSVITLEAADIADTRAILRAKINPCASTATAALEYGTNSVYGTSLPIAEVLVGTEPVLVSVLITNLQPGTVYHFRASASNAQGTTAGDDLTFTTLGNYSSWTIEQFGTNASNPAIAGETADPDGNGIPNLAEYAFGGSDHAWVIGLIQSNRFSLSYSHPARTDITYTAECATNLLGVWLSGPEVLETIGIVRNPDGTETVTVRCIDPLLPQQYMRIRVSRDP